MARARRIQQAPYYDSGSYQQYRGFLSAMREKMQSAEGSELAGIAQQTSAGVREMRKQASQQPKSIGYSPGNRAARNYDRYSEYRADDPYRPSMPGSESVSRISDTTTEQNRAGMADAGGDAGQNRAGMADAGADAAMATAVTESGGGESDGGGGGGDYRTNETMQQLARKGELAKFKDSKNIYSRNHEWNETYGPEGPMGANVNESEEEGQIRQELVSKLNEYVDYDDKKLREKGPTAVSMVRDVWKATGREPGEYVAGYMKGGDVGTFLKVGKKLVRDKYMNEDVTEEENPKKKIYWEIQGLKDAWKQAKKQRLKSEANEQKNAYRMRQLHYKMLNDKYSGG